MIPVEGVEGQTIAVLGLGRSGRATAAALIEGGPTSSSGMMARMPGPRPRLKVCVSRI